MMSAPSRGMSDSSYYETHARSGYDAASAGHYTSDRSPGIPTLDTQNKLGTAAFASSLGALSKSLSVKRKHVRSKFREEFGEAPPTQSPRSCIFSKLRVLSSQGRPSINTRDSIEVATNHIFLSDYDPNDALARRSLLYRGCPQAAGSAPDGWEQTLRRRELDTLRYFQGEAKSVYEFKPMADNFWAASPPTTPGSKNAAGIASKFVPSPLRTPKSLPRAPETDFLVTKSPLYGQNMDSPGYHSGDTREVTPWGEWSFHNRDHMSSDHACLGEDDHGVTMGDFEPLTAERSTRSGSKSTRWLFSKRSGSARKSGSNCFSAETISSDGKKDRPGVLRKPRPSQVIREGRREALPLENGYQEFAEARKGTKKLSKVVSTSSAPVKHHIG